MAGSSSVLRRRPALPLRPRDLSGAALRSVGVIAVVCFAAVAAFERRWITDDAMIYDRAVRQILAGHGPVYNVHERVETSTGTLWQWLLAALGLVRIPPDYAAVWLGLILWVAALVLGARASLRWSGADLRCWQVPLGMVVVAALPPFWDFATSGLETALTYFWIALSWYLLTRCLSASSPRLRLVTAVWLGLGPMIRPDMAVVTVAFGVCMPGLWRRDARLRPLRLAAAALVLPAGYEVFRMGYYGEIVPMPAITKEAGDARWYEGLVYLGDFLGPYRLAFPLVVVLVCLVAAVIGSRRRSWEHVAVGAAPVVASLASLTYVVRIGGDFMHARMLLPATLLFLLPVFVVPPRRIVVPACGLVAAWAVVCALFLRAPDAHAFGQGGLIADERAYYTGVLHTDHPMAKDYRRGFAEYQPVTAKDGEIQLAVGQLLPLAPDQRYALAAVSPSLGGLGAAVPLDGAAVDPIGLAYPLAAHMEADQSGRPGHNKSIPRGWIVADYVDPSASLPGYLDRTRIAYIREVLRCAGTQRLLAGSRAPMSVHRFFENLTSAFWRSHLRYSTHPRLAARVLCKR